MKKSHLLGAVCAGAFVLVVTTANAATVTQLYSQSEFSSTYNVINFEGYTNGTATNTLYADQGIGFSNFGSSPVPIFEWTSHPNYQTGDNFRITTSPDHVIATVDGLNGSIFSNFLDVNFLSGAYELGAFFGNDQHASFTQQTISIFDVSDVLLGIVSVTANVNTSVDQFIGLRSDTPFYKARFENDATNQLSVVLDDLTYVSAVPIPPSLWLFGSGLLGLIGVARNKLK